MSRYVPWPHVSLNRAGGCSCCLHTLCPAPSSALNFKVAVHRATVEPDILRDCLQACIRRDTSWQGCARSLLAAVAWLPATSQGHVAGDTSQATAGICVVLQRLCVVDRESGRVQCCRHMMQSQLATGTVQHCSTRLHYLTTYSQCMRMRSCGIEPVSMNSMRPARSRCSS